MATPKTTKPAKKPSKFAMIKKVIMGSGKKAAPGRAAAGKAPAANGHTLAGKKTAAPAKPAPAAPAAPVKGVKSAPVKPAPGPSAALKNAKAAAAAVAGPALTKTKKVKAAPVPRTHATDESVCREVACENLATTVGFCRMHYIKNWKKIKRKELILKEGKLNQYIEELVAKYPDKYIEAIRQDLATEKDFAKVIYDLDLEESIDDFDVEGEGVEGIIDSIKRDFDDSDEGGF